MAQNQLVRQIHICMPWTYNTESSAEEFPEMAKLQVSSFHYENIPTETTCSSLES